MNLHANAALSLKGRRELCRRVVERERTLAQAAEAAGVSVRCARKWVGRYRVEGEAGLRDRSSEPHRIPHRTREQRVEAIAALRRLRFTARRSPRFSAWRSRPSRGSSRGSGWASSDASASMEKKDEPKDRADLFRAGVLAFERVGLRKASDDLDQLSAVTAENLLPLLGAQDAYEAGLWVDILRSRVEAIDQFRHIADENEKEKVLQQHLFDHLWLLDPAWERAAVGGRMEENLKKIEPGLFAKDPQAQDIEGRIDIRYAKASGQHVIVELKRHSVRPTFADLEEQGLKYLTALRSILTQQQRTDTDIEVVFVLGHPPRVPNPGLQTEEEYIRTRFASINGRYVLYDALIENAKHQYEDYLNATDRAKDLDTLLGTWGTELAEAEGDSAEAGRRGPGRGLLVERPRSKGEAARLVRVCFLTTAAIRLEELLLNSVRRFNRRLMLPNTDDSPSVGLKSQIVSAIPRDV